MSVILVQSKCALADTVTLDAPTTPGNQLLIVVAWTHPSGPSDPMVSGITDDIGTDYGGYLTGAVGSPYYPAILVFAGQPAAAAHTFTAAMPVGATLPRISVSEFSGLAGTPVTTWSFVNSGINPWDETAHSSYTPQPGDLQFTGLASSANDCAFTQTGGDLLPQLNGAGAIGGMYYAPTAIGAAYPALEYSGSTGIIASAYCLIREDGGGALALSASLGSAVRQTPYSNTLNASGGTPPYTFEIASGALPAGLSLDSATGAITGTP